MWSSLTKLSSLPHDTLVFCAHEYTEANGLFAKFVEPENTSLLQYINSNVKPTRAKGHPSVPSVLSAELAANPFLRIPNNQSIRKALGLAVDADDVQTFAALRKLKDNFKATI